MIRQRRIKMRKELLAAGLGNPLMGDEGVGIFLIEQLSRQKGRFPFAEFADAGSAGVGVLHLIANRKKVIFVDCAYMRKEPGAIVRFNPDEVKTIKKFAGQSLHEGDLLKIIEMSKKLGECPEEIVIFGIEPAEVKKGMGLSRTITEKIDYYVEVISREIEAGRTGKPGLIY
jgi:hydrogenase maturation protease